MQYINPRELFEEKTGKSAYTSDYGDYIVWLEKQYKILSIKVEHSLANNLCPDHRDKQTGKTCLACQIENLERQYNNSKWKELS